MLTQRELEEKAGKAALELAAEKPWRNVRLTEIAKRADVSITEFYGRLLRDDVLRAVDETFDRACGEEPVSSDDSLRDRVFDLAMLRFEAMEDYREGVKSLRKSWKNRPSKRLEAAGRRANTAKWILTLAGEDGAGLQARSVILSGILFRAEEAWEKETGTDFTRTMAQLDRDLRDLESFADRVKSFSLKPRKKPKADVEVV